jgi:hypothetical protein
MDLAGVSQNGLTTRSKIPWTTLDRKLNVGSFTIRELYRIADALDIPVTDLLPAPLVAA